MRKILILLLGIVIFTFISCDRLETRYLIYSVSNNPNNVYLDEILTQSSDTAVLSKVERDKLKKIKWGYEEIDRILEKEDISDANTAIKISALENIMYSEYYIIKITATKSFFKKEKQVIQELIENNYDVGKLFNIRHRKIVNREQTEQLLKKYKISVELLTPSSIEYDDEIILEKVR